MDHPNPIYLAPTEIIDSTHPKIRNYAMKVVGSSSDTLERAVRLYLAVRDGIRYDPYTPFHRPEHYRASWVLERGRAFCIPKVSLLCALGRACHIPSRVGFATVKNHLATKQLIDFLGSNVFVYHGFVEFHLEGKWVKATPAFNRELCEKHQVEPLEFNGREDSLFHPYNQENRKYMEYVKYHGTYSDIPVETIVAAWNEAYGKERVDGWIKMFTQDEDTQSRDFDNEDVWHE
ncbi:MAG: transglutaminase domain-containing protein [Deltaproteobacteria bacterium]|nr:MAG: transglutaminase domain-containing protein [Deltaproteobacteria bacterium]